MREPEHDLESSSTVIGQGRGGQELASDLRLADDEEDSDIRPAGSSAKRAGAADDLKLADSEDLSDELSLADDLDFESDDALMLGDDGDLTLSAGSDQESAGRLGRQRPGDRCGRQRHRVGQSLGQRLVVGGRILVGRFGVARGRRHDLARRRPGLRRPTMAAALQQDEEFLLSPSDEMMGDESSDSGSQVIALDDSGAFDSDADVAVGGQWRADAGG